MYYKKAMFFVLTFAAALFAWSDSKPAFAQIKIKLPKTYKHLRLDSRLYYWDSLTKGEADKVAGFFRDEDGLAIEFEKRQINFYPFDFAINLDKKGFILCIVQKNKWAATNLKTDEGQRRWEVLGEKLGRTLNARVDVCFLGPPG